MALKIKCPANTEVIRLAVADRATVRGGDLLMILDDSIEQKYLATLKEQEAALNAHLELVLDDGLAKQRTSLSDEANRLADQVKRLTKVFDDERAESKALKRLDLYAILKTNDELLTAQENQSQVSVAVQRLDVDADITRRYIKRALQFISLEQEHAGRKIARLSIKAPIGGRVRLFVGEHASVKLGVRLAEIG